MATKPSLQAEPGRRQKPADYEADVKARLEKAMPGLYETFIEFRGKMVEQARSRVDYYWKLGRKLIAIKRECDKNKAGKAKVAVKVLGQALEINPTDANAAVRFAGCYPKEAHLQALLRGKSPTGKPLVWSHVRLLVTDGIEDDARGQWVERCLEEEWSPEELSERMQVALGQRPGKGGGREISRPKSVGQALTKWETMNRVWLKFGAEVYGKEDGLAEVIAATPDTKLTPDMLDQITKLEQQLIKMRDMTEPELKTLKSLRLHVSGVLNGKPAETPAASRVVDEEVEDDDDSPVDEEDEDEDDEDDEDDAGAAADVDEEDEDEDDEDDDAPAPPPKARPAKPKEKEKPAKEKARAVAARAAGAAGKKKRAIAR